MMSWAAPGSNWVALGRFGMRALARIGGVLLVVWGAATAGFFALKLVPGDPVDVMLGVHAQVGERVREQIREDWGLGEPVIVQYAAYLSRLLRGDLGESYQLRKPVADVLSQQAMATVQLTALAVAIALVLALAVALLARGPLSGRLASLLELFVISSPSFWLGLVLLTVFGHQLGWFPVDSSRGFASLLLPALALALPLAGILSQVMRQGLDDAETKPFALTARARGLDRRQFVRRHGLRHASSATITLAGYLVGTLLSGAVLVETVFARQGLGGVAVRAILGRDLPVVLGIIVWAAIIFAVLNLIVDLVYERLDPRVRALSGVTT
ncbi:MAG TPA: ABC transporter permease [Terrimesophilobacter sp.]|nr:ABC transporter permease [Terrimesophilobacter sp.]